MCSLKNQSTILVMGHIILVTMIFILVFYLQAKPIVLKDTEKEAKRDIAVAEEIIDLKYPGSWHSSQGILYKGQTEINNNYVLVDHIKELTGASCSIYLNNICVSTTEIEGDCNIRAVGKPVPKEVKSNILEEGEYYLGEAESAGKIYQKAYKPIINDEGRVIGVLSIGTQRSLYNSIIYGSMKMIGLAGLILALLTWLVTRFLVARRSIKSLREVDVEIKSLSLPQQEQVYDNNKDNDFEMSNTLLDLQQELPKGLSPITLKEIVLFLIEKEGNEVTVKDVSKAISLSTVTVRRYLDYLEECGLVDVEQEYGSVGRPLRIYKLKD